MAGISIGRMGGVEDADIGSMFSIACEEGRIGLARVLGDAWMRMASDREHGESGKIA